MEKARTLGMMVECTWANGKTITCMVRGVIPGRTAGPTKVIIEMIKSTALGFILGLMVDATKANGKQVNSTDKVLITSQGNKQRKEFGMKGPG